MAQQLGLGEDVPQPLTMGERHNMALALRRQGATDDMIRSTLGEYTSPTPASAGLEEDVDDGMGVGGLLGYGAQQFGESVVRSAGDFVGDRFGWDGVAEGMSGIAEAIGPDEAQEEARARRRDKDGDGVDDQGFLGEAGDLMVSEAPGLAATIGIGMGAGAAAGSVVPGAGTVVGAVVGAGIGWLRMRDEARTRAVEENKKAGGTGDLSAEELNKVDLVAAISTAPEAFAPLRAISRISKVGGDQIITSAIKKAVKEGSKDAVLEGTTEVFQSAVQEVAFNEELRSKLTDDEVKEIAPYVLQEFGRDAAMAFVVGSGLGGAAGTATGGYQQSMTNAKMKGDVQVLNDAGAQAGVNLSDLEAASKDPEKAKVLIEAADAVGKAERQYAGAEAELKKAIGENRSPDYISEIERRRDAARRDADKVRDIYLPKFGGMTTGQVKERAKAEKEDRTAALKGRAKTLGIEAKDNATLEENMPLVEELEALSAKTDDLKGKVSRATGRGRRVKKMKELEAAIEKEAKLRGEIAHKVEGKDPAKVESEYLAARRTEARAAKEKPAIDRFYAELDGDLVAAEKIVAAADKKKKSDDKETEKEIKALQKKRQDVASVDEMEDIDARIEGLRARQVSEKPLVQAARRVVEDAAPKSEEVGTEQAAAPSQPEPSQKETKPADAGVQTPESSAAKTGAPAAATQKAPAKAEPEVAAITPPDMTNVRQERIKDYHTARRDADTKSMDVAAEAILGDLGIPASSEAVAAFNGGPKRRSVEGRVKAAQEAVLLADQTVGVQPAAAVSPATVAAGSDAAKVPANDPRREGDDISRQNRWQPLIDDVDPDAGMAAHEDFLRQWTADNGFEASATYDADGNLLGIGTNRHANSITVPLNGWNQPNITFTHTHPDQTPMSAADVKVLASLNPEGTSVRAVLPDGQVTEITRGSKELTRDVVEREFGRLRDALDETIPAGLGLTAAARIKQEAFLRHMDAEGYIEYTQPMSGFSAAEENVIYGAIDQATSDTGVRDDVGDGAPASEGRQDGAEGAAVAPQGAGTAAALDIAQTADAPIERPEPADPEAVRAITKPFFEAQQKGLSVSDPKGTARVELDKPATRKEMKQVNMDRALAYAASSLSWEGSEASTTALQTMRVLFPQFKFNTKSFVKDPGGNKLPVLDADWQRRFSATLQFLRYVGQDQGMGFPMEMREFVRHNGQTASNWYFKENRQLNKAIGIAPPAGVRFRQPMSDPSDTSQIKRRPDMAFSEAAVDRMRPAAAAMQENVFYIDQEAVANLIPDELVSDKSIKTYGMDRDESTGKIILSNDPERRARQEKRLKSMLFRAEKKLAMLQRMARDHGDQPLGYMVQADNKGRLYLNGTFNPQTGDAVKKVLRVGAQDGPLLKDYPMADHSASGWQMTALMTGDEVAAGYFNLGPYTDQSTETDTPLAMRENYKKRDVYNALMTEGQRQIEADAEAGNPQAQLFKKQVFDTTLPFGKGEIKPAVIAVNYAGDWKNFRERLRAVYRDEFTDAAKRDEAGNYADPGYQGMFEYVSNKLYDQLASQAPKAMAFQNWAIKNLTDLIKQVEGKKNALSDKPDLEFSVGLDGTYKALKPKTKKFQAVAVDRQLRVAQELEAPTKDIDPAATARSIFSQIIQGFDASVLHRAVPIYREANPGEFVSTNHDSYTVPPGKAGAVAAAARQAMQEIFSELEVDAPTRLLREIEAQAEKYGVKLGNIRDPKIFNEDGTFKMGNYDMEKTLPQSVPMFVENADDAAPAYTDVRGNLMEGAPSFPEIARGIDYEASDTGAETGVRMDTSLPKAAQFAQDNQFPTGRDFKVQMQEQALQAQRESGVDLTTDTPDNVDRLADFVFEDAKAAVVNNRNAIGWYGRTVDAAKAELRKLHPEMTPGSDAEFQFSWALAVTSNGLKVDKNFQLAEQAYSEFKKTGKFPTNIGVGEAAQQINSGLQYYQQLVDRLGSVQAARDFMTTRLPVRDIERISGNKVSKEGKGTVLPGAVILGPKIGGGFFSNLYGNFNELTMDRWFTRTVGRWRGTLIKDDPANTKLKQDQMRAALRELAPDDLKALRALYDGSGVPIRKTMSAAQLDALAMETAKRSMKPDWRAQINSIPGGEAVRKVGNMHAKYLDGQVEDPGGAKARTFLREVFNKGLDRLRAEPDMSDLTMADLQALLWYPEKRLYDTAKKPVGEEVTGYDTEEAPDYATAAAKLVRDRLGQAGRDGAGPVAGGAGAEPSFGPPLAAGVDAEVSDRDGGTPVEGEGRAADGGVVRQSRGAVGGYARSEDRVGYANAMRKAGLRMGPEAGQVSVIGPDAEGVARYMAADGKSGFGLDGDNIIGVFADPSQPGSAKRILEAAVANGGRRLDGFDTFLPKVYARGGFKAVARLPFDPQYAPTVEGGALADWDANGMERMGQRNAGKAGWAAPDVVFMVYDPEGATPETDNTVGDYDEGIAAQDAALEAADGRATEGGTQGSGRAGSGDDAGGGQALAAGIDEWLGSKPDTTDAKVKSEIDYAVGNGRTSPNAALAFIRHSPLFGYDTIMNNATKRDGSDYGPQFFEAHANFTKGMGAKLAQISRTVPDTQVPFYLKMVKAQKNDHIKKLLEGIERGTIQVSDVDPVTKTYRPSGQAPSPTERAIGAVQSASRTVTSPLASSMAAGVDIAPLVKAAPPKRGIAPPVEYKTPQTIRAAVTANLTDPKGTFGQLNQWINKQGRALGRQVMNRQAGFKQIERLVGKDEASVHDGMSKFAQMMTASTGRVAAMMSFGAPKWNAAQKIYEIDRNTKGLDEIFQFNGVEDYQNFSGWAFAKRDRDLMSRGKSPRMTDDLRTEYESIPAADKARYDAMLGEYKKYNQALRQLMKDSGLINDAQMKALEADNEYVPMYRVFEDPEALGIGAIFKKDGFSHPDPGIKGMKEDVWKVGDPGAPPFGDLIEGIHNNAVAVMHAASQNLAHKQVYDFMSSNLSHEITVRKLGKKEKKAARKLGDQDAVKFLDNGKEVYWRAQGDKEWTGALQMALAGLSPTQLDGIDIALKKFNSFQRAVITSTPAFAIRSVVRDMGQAYVQTGTNPGAIAKKNADMLKESWGQYSQSTQNLMMASGVGGYQMQGMPEVDAANLRRKVGAQENGRLNQIAQAFGKYERIVGSTELGARASVYDGELGKTGDPAAAAYEALNMIDYNRKGASPAIQKLSYMILFLNPRLQGLYRLFEASSGDGPTKYAKVSASLAARGLVLTGLGLAVRALTAMNDEDEERYRALSVADRATYFHIPVPGLDRFLRLPKPFEVGAAFATLPVAGIDAVAMGPEGMDDLGSMAMHVFMETFSFNPTPQAIRPVAEAMLNRNMFTGREIEGMRLQNLPKAERIDAQTTGMAQVISKYVTGSGVSPAMVQHLMNGYLGPLGMLGVNVTDATLAGAGIVPDKSAQVDGVFGNLPTALKVPADFTAKWLFSSTEGERSTRYVGEFYELHTQIKQYTAAINEAVRVGDLEKAASLKEEAAHLRPMKSALNKVNSQMSELNRQMRIAQNSPNLTEAQRQERMAKINIRKNKIARDAIEKAREVGAL